MKRLLGLSIVGAVLLAIPLSQRAMTAGGDPQEVCEGDISGDGRVGVPDLLLLLANFGACPDCEDCIADLTDDCSVGVPDLLIVLRNFGCGPAACISNANCDDGNPCTVDLCIGGSCFNFPIPHPIPGCCGSDADCGDKCKNCDLATNRCFQIPGCCSSDADCRGRCEACDLATNTCFPIDDCP